jgi:hypothetical protein
LISFVGGICGSKIAGIAGKPAAIDRDNGTVDIGAFWGGEEENEGE